MYDNHTEILKMNSVENDDGMFLLYFYKQLFIYVFINPKIIIKLGIWIFFKINNTFLT